MADIIGSADNDSLVGSADNDTINGGFGQDTIEGGLGNDFLMGSAQNQSDPTLPRATIAKNSDSDVYFFSSGFGQDTISEDENIPSLLVGISNFGDTSSPSRDVIRLGASFTPNDVYLELVDDYHLRLRVHNSTDSILFNVGAPVTTFQAQQYENANSDVVPILGIGVESIEFADGTVWDTVEVLRQLLSRVVSGDANDNQLTGGRSNDTLLGAAGNDTLTGVKGRDLFDGGAGNDLVLAKGGEYNAGIDDTVLFNIGSGHDTVIADTSDTILLGAGLDRNQLQSSGYQEKLIDGRKERVTTLSFGDADSLTVSPINSLPAIRFADGSLLTLEDIRAASPAVVQGTSGSDTLIGWDGGVNTFAALAGNDTIEGGVGSRDTVLFNQGDGQDTFYAKGNDDLITLGNGLLKSAMTVSMTNSAPGSPQAITMAWGTDSITVVEPQPVSGIPQTELVSVKFADGTMSSLQDIVALVPKSTLTGTNSADTLSARYLPVNMLGMAGSDNLTGSAWADMVDGGAGNDAIDGASGADTLRGQSGDDTIMGGLGNDLMEGGAGRDVFYADEYIYSYSYVGLPPPMPLLAGGNDTMVGAAGADTYAYNQRFSEGSFIGNRGNDVILDYDINTLNQDQLVFSGAYKTDQLWFSRSGQDLKITLLGGADQGGTVTVQKWFDSSAYRIEKLTANDAASGSTKALTASRVNNLVTAMSRFAPPAPGATAIDASTQAQLATVLASNWK